MPPGLKVETPELSSVAEWKTADGVLSYRRTARLLSPEIPVDRYAPFRETVSIIVVVGGITYLTLVLGEIVPKRFALSHADRLARNRFRR